MVKTEHSEISTEEPWVLQDEIFDPKNMMEKLNRFADEEGLVETKKALKYAAEKHAGAVRKGSPYAGVIPYIIHPLTMACQAHALGIRDDRCCPCACFTMSAKTAMSHRKNFLFQRPYRKVWL